MAHLQFVFERSASFGDWRERTATPAPQCDVTCVPLPPGCTPHLEARLNSLVCRLRTTDRVDSCSVETVIGIGTFGEIAARLFTYLTDSSLYLLEKPYGFTTQLNKFGNQCSSLLVCLDTELGSGALNAASLALQGAGARIGFVYANDVDSAVLYAFKASFPLPDRDNDSFLLIDSMTRSTRNISLPGWRSISTSDLEAAHAASLLSDPTSTMKGILTHGNGFDYQLGEAVLCGLETEEIPHLNHPAMFPCFHTGKCLRTKQTRILPQELIANVLILASCLGVMDGPPGIDISSTAFHALMRGANVWSMINTAHYWVASPEVGLQMLAAVGSSDTLGSLVHCLDKVLDPLASSAFLLFGNPNATITQRPLAQIKIDSKILSVGISLSPGLYRLYTEQDACPPIILVTGTADKEPVMRVSRDTDSKRSDSIILMAGSELCLKIPTAKKSALGIAEIEATAQGLLHFAEQFLLELTTRDIADNYRAFSFTLRNNSRALARAFRERGPEGIVILTNDEAVLLQLLYTDLSRLGNDLTVTYRDWCIGENKPRFLLSVWQAHYEQVAVEFGKSCTQCGAPMREHIYKGLNPVSGDRRISHCPLCSLRSDLPLGLPLTLTVKGLDEDIDHFNLRVSVTQNGLKTMQLSSAAFLMSGYAVWRESASEVKIGYRNSGESWDLQMKIMKPPETLIGDHWFVLIGLADGTPYAVAHKVIMDPAAVRLPSQS